MEGTTDAQTNFDQAGMIKQLQDPICESNSIVTQLVRTVNVLSARENARTREGIMQYREQKNLQTLNIPEVQKAVQDVVNMACCKCNLTDFQRLLLANGLVELGYKLKNEDTNEKEN